MLLRIGGHQHLKPQACSLIGGDTVLDIRLLQRLHGLHHCKQLCHVVIPKTKPTIRPQLQERAANCCSVPMAEFSPSLTPSLSNYLPTPLPPHWHGCGFGRLLGLPQGRDEGMCVCWWRHRHLTYFSRSRAFLYNFTSCWKGGQVSQHHWLVIEQVIATWWWQWPRPDKHLLLTSYSSGLFPGAATEQAGADKQSQDDPRAGLFQLLPKRISPMPCPKELRGSYRVGL